jgi:murein DD-endopeptidase MepM/ murein hydrolase activator NlpD
MARRSYTYGKKSGSSGRIVGFLLVAAAAAGAFFLQRELRLPPAATVEISADRPAIGRKTVITVRAREPRLGLARVVATADGAGFSKKVVGATPAEGAFDPIKEVVLEIPVGREPTPDIKPGTVLLEVTVEARGTRLRQPKPVVLQKHFEVKLDPPAIAATSAFIHPAQGGAEAVVYEVGPTSQRDGVQAGHWFFPGFPLPGGRPTQRFALFAVPYDFDIDEPEARSRVLLVAEDELGNRAAVPFIHKYFRRPLRRDTIELGDPFMKKVTTEIFANTPSLRATGNLLADYLLLNRDLRKQNMAELVTLASKSRPQFLWRATFMPMQKAAVKGSFADRRSYTTGGKEVDTQDHLGLDLASLEHAPVPAANAGIVALARYFGIFGNCVVVDHGYGLMSLYAHLSSIAVKEGDSIDRGHLLGKSGATGLAGGDHLHFTMMLHGLPVTPIEWWDDHWLQDRLKLKLGDALPWKGGR